MNSNCEIYFKNKKLILIILNWNPLTISFCEKDGKANHVHYHKKTYQYDPYHFLISFVLYCFIYWRKKQPCQKATQMPEYIHICRSQNAEKENKHDDHNRCATKLILHDWTNDIQSTPVNYHITNYHTDHPIQWSRCTCLNVRWINQSRENVASNSWQHVNKKSPDKAKWMLNSGHKHENRQHVAKKVQKVHVQKNGRNQAIDLPLPDVRCIIGSQLQQSASLDFQKWAGLIESNNKLYNVHNKSDNKDNCRKREALESGATQVFEHVKIVFVFRVFDSAISRYEQNFMGFCSPDVIDCKWIHLLEDVGILMGASDRC